MGAVIFPRWDGVDQGLPAVSVPLTQSPDARNWVNTDGIKSVHGPRRASAPYAATGRLYPIRHLHRWSPRGKVPYTASFSDDGDNMILTLGRFDLAGPDAIGDEYLRYDTKIPSTATAMFAGTWYYLGAGTDDGTNSYSTAHTAGTGFTANDLLDIYDMLASGSFRVYTDSWSGVLDVGVQIGQNSFFHIATVDCSGMAYPAGVYTEYDDTPISWPAVTEYWVAVRPDSDVPGNGWGPANPYPSVSLIQPGDAGSGAEDLQLRGYH